MGRHFRISESFAESGQTAISHWQGSLKFFGACVTSKLLYCLHVTWLNASELRNLDAFRLRCLRKNAGIRHSYCSRVSNGEVLERVGGKYLSEMLHRQQLLYIATIAREPDESVLRSSIFEPGGICIKTADGPRNRGRPRMTWAAGVFQMGLVAAGGLFNLTNLWANTATARNAWKRAIPAYLEMD